MDVPGFLKAAALGELPFSLIAEKEVWQACEADNQVAARGVPTWTAFTYIDLTSKGLLAPWLPPEAIGGKLLMPGIQE